ncbi:pyridoxal phosphate-dependent aminotransferase [Pseudonocardia asaccharolytica]|uniref:Aminotransferase n=1 Tax=Pseudonocardia asaccharolytica DSM 44247 = NBRC 16224 TaxID=1123024 RepID=A0A511CVJ6_9PSEU|nr:aminotransferase class I/II-fold pyridoxal phosphate-dependent enzyme [Pseudonocardia asaccharolytica]GEL16595.1 aminotransferase [Pseudonocardia asaccharolytica DSM 44247 = NBRC 16224]
MPRTSDKADRFTESVIRETFRLAARYGAINLGQGFPDHPCPPELKAAACAAIEADDNQYPMTFGTPQLRAAIAVKTARTYPGWEIDPDTELCVTCGATEALVAVTFALLDPGDEVVLFEPWYENYRPNAILAGAVPRLVRMHRPDWSFDEAELRAAFGPRTRAVFLCHPNNPTGKIYRAEELAVLAELCRRWDAVLVVDSIYEHIHYLGPGEYRPPALVPGLEDRTVTVNALSKTYAVTGWRVGWTVAPPRLTTAIRKVHDFLTIAAPAPLQAAGVAAMGLPASYYTQLAADYLERRDLLCDALERIGFDLRHPDGSYYVLCDTRPLDPSGDGVVFARRLITEIGVSCVPAASFWCPEHAASGRSMVRFAFPKRLETLRAAIERLEKLRI